jgi:glycosyltransferase involved in cell wall biosynthesis
LVPFFNEAPIIRRLVKGLKAEGLLEKYRVVLYDDGSSDNSFEIMEECTSGIQSVVCIRNHFNQRKVGAIEAMAKLVQTPFLLTLDADCMLTELEDNALERLTHKMTDEGYAASCFRIVPHDTNWLGRLQKLDYVIFTDALRSLLGVPVCLIGQGVVWRTDKFLEVLANHTGEFHGDDLENTVIALDKKMRIYWERHTILLHTIPKRTILALIRQRALSWDFGMLRVLFAKRAWMLAGETGAFYKNVLLMDILAHPFRLVAVPLLLSVPLIKLGGLDPYADSGLSALYRKSVSMSLRYGAWAIALIWVLTILNTCICVWPAIKSVKKRIIAILKWASFNAVYLFSPFVYFAYFKLVIATDFNAYDILGSTIYWIGLGLALTYAWWLTVTFCLLWKSSLQANAKVELIWSGLWAPVYFFVLLVVCKTGAIIKYIWRKLVGH